jgi:hypothetical protein
VLPPNSDLAYPPGFPYHESSLKAAGQGLRPPPAGADVATFGEKLRQQREQRGISLEAISKTTKISTRLLRALEDERFDQLPGGVFNKGFVRAYARQVGLDEEEALGDYHTALRESLIQEEKILSDLRIQSAKRGGGYGAWALETIERRKQARRSSDRRKEERRNRERRSPDRHHDNRPIESRVQSETGVKDEPGIETRQQENRRNGASLHPEPHENRAPNFPADVLSGNVHSADTPSVNYRSANSPSVGLAPESHEHPQDGGADVSAFPPRDLKDHTATENPANDFPALDRAAGNTVIDGTGSGAASVLPVQQTPASTATPSGFWISRSLIAAAVLLLVVILALWRSRHRTGLVTSAPPAAASAPTVQPTAPLFSQNHPATPGASISPALNSQTAPTSPKISSHPSAPPSLGPFTVVIRADKTTSISVSADGESVAHETLIAPAATSVHASHDVIVKAANGAALSFLLNGKLIRPQAAEGEAKTYVLNSNGLIGAPQAAAANP